MEQKDTMTPAPEFMRRWASLPKRMRDTKSFPARTALVRYCQGFIEREMAIQTAEMAMETERLKGQKE